MTTTTAKRRPNGAGTVRRRGGTDRQPLYEASFFLRSAGQRRQVAKGGFGTKKEAEGWLRDQIGLRDEGRAVLPSTRTVGALLDDWLAVARHRLTASTALNYASIIDGRLRPYIGDVRLSDLGPAEIARCYDQLRTAGAVRADLSAVPVGERRGQRPASPLSETSVQRTHQVLRTALAWAVKQRLVVNNPADDVDKPRRRKVSMAAWNGEQLAAFLASVQDDRLAPILHVLAFTGMRRGEVLGLKWSHLNGSVVEVQASRVKVGSTMVEQAGGKSAAASRVIDLDPRTLAVLARWKLTQKADRLAWGPGYTHSDYVFTREDGQPVHADHLAGRFERLVAASGVPRIRLHDLRHTHASLMLRANVPVKVVSERLGHASPAFTMTCYQSVLPGMQADAAATFAALLAGEQ